MAKQLAYFDHKCVNCGMCQKTCPVNKKEANKSAKNRTINIINIIRFKIWSDIISLLLITKRYIWIIMIWS